MISQRRFLGNWAALTAVLCCVFLDVDVSRAATTQVAFLDFDASAVGGLLEARLIAKSQYRWVERANIDHVVRERQTQALFSPAGVSERATLGRTLKADVLVLLRTVAAKESKPANDESQAVADRLDLIICETHHGLRLAAHSLQAPKPGEEGKLVERLEGWTEAVLRRADRSARDICAVPSFVSNDLSFAMDYLKQAYANVVEQTVFQHGGFAVVELAEAEALAKELILVGEGNLLDRRLPLYLLGEYRHEAEGESRRVRLKLRLLRGTAQLGVAEKGDMKSADVPAYLQQATSELLRQVSDDAEAVYDAKTEARQLAQRAREFMDLGNYEEAMPLLDASLLLGPDDHDVRRDAVVVGGKMAMRYFHHRDKPTIAVPAMRHFRRGMEHLEVWLSAHPQPPMATSTSFGRTFVDEFHFDLFYYSKPNNADVRAVYDELLPEIDAALLRITRMRSRQNAYDASRYLDKATAHLPSRERFRIIGQLALELQDLPGAGRRTGSFVIRNYDVRQLEQAGGAELLAELAKARNPEVRETAARLQTRLKEAQAKPPQPLPAFQETAPDEPKLPLGPTVATFTPITLETMGGDQETANFCGCLPAGRGIDVVWTSRALYVMKQRGSLRKVWEGSELNDRFNITTADGQFFGYYVSYDGRYVWATVGRLKLPPLLLVLDPLAETVQEITAADGLPLASTEDLSRDRYNQHLAVAGMEPGRACVAGSFGRSWIATVKFDPAGSHHVKVIHECRRAPDPLDSDQWQSADVAFDATYVFSLTDTKSGETRVLMGRGNRNPHFDTHPLLIDPVRERVEVVSEPLPRYQFAGRFALYGGALYYLDNTLKEGRDTWGGDIRVSRFGAPTWKRETLMQNVPQGWPVVADEQVHIVGKRWWSSRLPNGPVHVAAAEVPWHYRNDWAYPGQSTKRSGFSMPPQKDRLEGVWPSNHFGLLVRTVSRDHKGYDVYQANITSKPQ